MSLRTALVGCGPMARWHTGTVQRLEGFELVALADISEENLAKLGDETGIEALYTDYAAMLSEHAPEVVVVVTPCATHAGLSIQAAEAGARGVFCEKPMATCLADGRAMVEACAANGTALAVNHQRRMSPPILKLRELLDEGAIGEVKLFRGSCAGDLLSDATHLVDTIRFLAGDAPVAWVFGQVHREVGEEQARDARNVQLASAGFRYGHAVETGAMAVFEFEGGVRAELLVGDMRLMDRAYGDYEVFGTEGRLWRAGDMPEEPLLLQDSAGGWRPIEVEPVDAREAYRVTADATYRRFAEIIHEGGDHPLSGDSALLDLEVIMAVFESARLREKVTLPLRQERFPLDIMIEKGEL